MSQTVAPGRSPWHVWVVGAVALLWNVSGAVTILLAQTGRLPNPEPDELVYYAGLPLWFMVVSDVALAAAIAAALGLLFRRRLAVGMFALSLGVLVITNGYELAIGTSRMLVDRAVLMATIVIAAIATLELIYASAMTRRGLLR